MKNNDIRLLAAGKGVRLWQIADAIGMADHSLSRKLRKELPEREKSRIRDIIDNLAKGTES